MSIINSSYYPDLSADCDRSFNVIDYTIKKFTLLKHVLSTEILSDYLSSLLDSRTVGEQSEIIIQGIKEFMIEKVNEELDNYSYLLSKLSGLDPLPLRTLAGITYIYKNQCDKLTEKFMKSLPNNKKNSYSYTIFKLLKVEEQLISGEYIIKLYEIWNTTSRVDSFDKTLIRLATINPSLERLSNSILRFESNKHTNLVWHEANKLEKSFPNKTSSELLSYGYIGLRTALRLYDPTLGFRFSTYACSRINGTIRDGVRAESPIPKRLTTFSRKVSSAESELQQILGRNPSIAEIANRINEEVEKFQILPKLAPEYSIEDLLTNDDGNSKSTSWEGVEQDPCLLIISQFESEEINKAFQSLSKLEKRVISMVINDNSPLGRIADEVNLTTREVRLIRDKAYIKLRKSLYNILA